MAGFNQDRESEMKSIVNLLGVLLFVVPLDAASQIVAGSAEDKMFQRITAESNPEAKLEALAQFEKQFPQSKALPDAYLMMIELYRQKNDRPRVLEYGEKVLKLDDDNITALMVLARNYAIDGKSVDRAVTLAQQAVDQVAKMREASVPSGYTDAQWQEYLQTTELAAKSILNYAKGIKSRRTPH
jgi:hypothetical protein